MSTNDALGSRSLQYGTNCARALETSTLKYSGDNRLSKTMSRIAKVTVLSCGLALATLAAYANVRPSAPGTARSTISRTGFTSTTSIRSLHSRPAHLVGRGVEGSMTLKATFEWYAQRIRR